MGWLPGEEKADGSACPVTTTAGGAPSDATDSDPTCRDWRSSTTTAAMITTMTITATTTPIVTTTLVLTFAELLASTGVVTRAGECHTCAPCRLTLRTGWRGLDWHAARSVGCGEEANVAGKGNVDAACFVSDARAVLRADVAGRLRKRVLELPIGAWRGARAVRTTVSRCTCWKV